MTRLEPHATHDDARAVAKGVRALARLKGELEISRPEANRG